MRRRLIIAGLLALAAAGVYAVPRFLRHRAEMADAALSRPAPRVPTPGPAFPADLCVLTPPDAYAMPVLERELIRQAVLIAAREGLALRTRDAGLREFVRGDDDQEQRAVSLRWGLRDGRPILEFSRGGFPTARTELPAAEGDRVTGLARAAEAAARGEFVARLAGLGFERGDRPKAAPTEPPEPTAAVTDRFDLPSQYAAARGWHAAIRSGGRRRSALPASSSPTQTSGC